MPATRPEGLTPLHTAGAAILKLNHIENDPAAILRTRYRLVWDTVVKRRALDAERIGGRWYVRDAALPELAAALGITQTQPRKARPARRAAPSNMVAA